MRESTSRVGETCIPYVPWGSSVHTVIFSEKSKMATPTFESVYQPEPLTVEIQIQLLQYRSVEEAFLSLLD